MGWLFVHRDSSQSIADFFKTELKSPGRYEVLDCVVVKNEVAYLAVRHTNKVGVSVVGAVVCLLEHATREYNNFGYKDIDETMGPAESECPERILKQLTPLESAAYQSMCSSVDYAKDWRDRCRSNLPRCIRLKAGDRLRSLIPVHFGNGQVLTEFVVKDARRCVMTGADGRLYKLPRELINAHCEVVG